MLRAPASAQCPWPRAAAWLRCAALPLAITLLSSGARGADVPLEEDGVPAEPTEDVRVTGPDWMDESHAFATNRAQALAQWLDDFFGAEVRDAERADTFVRVITADNWDQREDHDVAMRLRGQINLPKVSERVDLIFSGEENEQTLSENERSKENDFGLRFNVADEKRLRLDATLSLRSGPALLPGLRARYQRALTEETWYRLTQRLQYNTDDGYRALSNVDINTNLDSHTQLRWGARLRYREDEGYWDWNSGISWRRWLDDHNRYPSAVEAYVSLSGRDDPEPFNSNYRIGLLFRQQLYRDYLYYEIEPNYDWRRDRRNSGRGGVWGLVLRFEVILGERDGAP